MVRVGVNGFGTIGRRVAQAVTLQPDMELVGVVKTRPDYAALQAAKAGIRIYAPSSESLEAFEKAGIRVEGTVEDLLSRVDVIVDATPNGVGEKYKPLYRDAGVRQVFQGGEKPSVADASFNTLCNYREVLGLDSVRVVSCNTTGLLRLICTINRGIGVSSVSAVLIRRAADPREVKRGPVNSINLNPPTVPSHHALDVKTVVPSIDIVTSAVVVPTTLMHVHHVTITLKRDSSRREVLSLLEEAPRIILIDSGRTGIKSTAQLMDAVRFMRRNGDLPELAVFTDSIHVEGRRLMLFQAVHQESIVVPENIDAIRALARLTEDPMESIRVTDETLGLTKEIF